MRRQLLSKSVVSVVLLSLVCVSVASAEQPNGEDRFSPHFFGLNTDWDFSADADAPVRSFISSQYLGGGVSYGYGRGLFRPRARLNLGWLFGRGFAPSAGIELPLVERLNAGMSKLFGVYLIGDVGWVFDDEQSPFYRLAPHIRIPIGPLEGIGIGAAYHSERGWSITLSRIMGGYPLKKSQ